MAIYAVVVVIHLSGPKWWVVRLTLSPLEPQYVILVVMMHVITQKQGETNKTDWHAL